MELWIRFRIRLVILIIAGIGTLLISIWLSQQKKTVKYSGVVVNSETGSPVPNAKVVLSTWHYGIMDSWPVSVGIFTDENGRFTVGASPGYWIDRVDLSASSPESLYSHLVNPREENEMRIEVSPLDIRLADIDAFKYATFSGPYWTSRRNFHWIPKK